jgi:glycosyltransferase involved in cell wall biosynthesis
MRSVLSRKKTIVLVIYSDPKMFPPTVHAANILDENGWRVFIVGIRYQKAIESIQINPGVTVVYSSSHATGAGNFFNYCKLCFDLLYLSVRKNVNVFLGYDCFTALPVFLASFLTGKKWVYHQHDYFEFPQTMFQRANLYCEHRLSRLAAFTVFPQEQRAAVFAKKNHFKKEPLIVYNGPRRVWAETRPVPHPIIAEMRERFRYILIYQGSLARTFAVENLINAVAKCKSDVGVIILGKELEKGIKQSYWEMISGMKMTERFAFLDFLPYHEISSVTCSCDVGIAKLTNDDPSAPLNDRFLIGASNKITEYIACGLPVITSGSVANAAFLKKYAIGVMCDVQDPGVFAAVIDALLADHEKLAALKKNNTELFLSQLNYDIQFGPCLEKLNDLANK